MMGRGVVGLLALGMLLLAGCAVSPIEEAEAVVIEQMGEQEVADRVQAREHREALDMIQEQEAAIRAERWSSVVRVGSVGLMVMMIGLGFGAGVGGAVWLVGRSLAHSVQGVVRAGTVPLDPVTRQFPLMMMYAGKGKFSLVNPNIGQVMTLDSRIPGDRMLIQGSMATQLAGAIADEARRSNDPASVAIIRPVMVDSGVGVEGDSNE